MTDLTQLLPNFPIDGKAYHTLGLLEAKGVTTLDLLTLAPADVCARTGLRRDAIDPFIAAVSKALREDMGVGRSRSSGINDEKNNPEAQATNIEGLKVLNGLEAIERTGFITTADPVLDKVLGGGIATGYIIEVVGER
jgi:DNA repair protein RAD57